MADTEAAEGPGVGHEQRLSDRGSVGAPLPPAHGPPLNRNGTFGEHRAADPDHGLDPAHDRIGRRLLDPLYH